MTISVIIPTLNEEAALPALLSALQNAPHIDEVIVVDGGSDDATCAIAEKYGTRILHSPRGRGEQLCAAANAATGDLLWFLHADTLPAPDSTKAIVTGLAAEPEAPGGNFCVLFDGDSGFARWLTGFYAWLRSHGIYYGDSAIFVRRTVYDRIGGLRPMALMEDYDFVRRLERAGPTLNISAPSITTSSRRFQNRAPWRIFMQWLVIHAMYYARVPGQRMARLYRSETHSPGNASNPKQPDDHV